MYASQFYALLGTMYVLAGITNTDPKDSTLTIVLLAISAIYFILASVAVFYE